MAGTLSLISDCCGDVMARQVSFGRLGDAMTRQVLFAGQRLLTLVTLAHH